MDEAGDNYTAAERKIGIDKINTGLKQDWEEDEDSSEEDNDDEMVGVGMAVTAARRTSVGQMELDVRPIPKKVDGKTMDRRDLLRLANVGIVPDHNAR
jgi:mediator of RNA polymerase II transcription subunit 8